MTADDARGAVAPATSIAVLGLGEAGSLIARDLVAAGAAVRGYDPVAPVPPGVTGCTDESDAVDGVALVLSVNSASDAPTALRSALPRLRPDALWADLNTGAASLKRSLAESLADAAPTALFADVALMTPVPGRGLRTPMLVSGSGGARYAELLGPLGADVEVLEGPPGDAATRKLLRSVFFKGLAAAVVEALTAARTVGLEDWLHDNITDELSRSDAGTVERLVSGSEEHAVRRSHEMDAAAQLLQDLGVTPRIAAASRDQLDELARARDPGAR